VELRFNGQLQAPCTFQVSDQGGRWRVSRNSVFWGTFHSHGDAVRAACFGARAEEQHRGPARVLAPPNDQLMPHYDAHFGL
jgi:hypothetical protein